MPKEYRKKPIIVEAMKYLREENISVIQDWFDKNNSSRHLIYSPEINEYCVKTLGGIYVLNKGDFIIKDANDEFYPCKPDKFKKTYEKVK